MRTPATLQRRAACRLAALLFAAVLVPQPAWAAATASPQADTGNFPITDPLAATVVGTPPNDKAELPTGIGIVPRSLAPLVQRTTPPTLRYARPLQYLYVGQDKPAPLVFLIAGTGASALSSKCVLLLRALHAVGYDVACLPSPTSVTFMLGAASYPVPGRMSTDVRDIYRLMQAVRDDLRDDGVQITSYALAGWSLGGAEAAFVARLDQQQQVFNFSRVLLLNPAVNLWDSVQRMDQLLADNLPGGINGVPAFVARAMGNLQSVYGAGEPLRFNEAFLYRAYRANAAGHADYGAIIGLVFRLALANMAFAADQITHTGLLVPRDVQLGAYTALEPYMEQAFKLTFGDYVNKLLLPYWNRDGHHLSKTQLIAEADLRNIRGFLATHANIAVFTNADDPILSAGEVDFLRHTFGKRARIRPHGGHMGNLQSRASIHAIQRYFAQ